MRTLIPVLVLCVAVSAGCRKETFQETTNDRPGQTTNIDSLGNFPAPQRIVSLAPNITELLFDLGAGNRVVGVTKYCNFPPEATELPKIGGFLDPSLEAVVALEPDLVVVMTNPGNQHRVDALTRLGLRVLWLSVRNLREVRESFAVLGKALKIEDIADRRLQAFDTAIKTHVARVPTAAARPKTLVVIGHRPLVVAGAGTFVSDLVKLAGGDNVASTSTQPYPQWSSEALLQTKPQVIIDAWMGDESTATAELDRWRRMKNIPAVTQGRVHRWSGDDRLLRPGPRLPSALGRLVDLLHPEASPSAR